jgi:hypothetical protein
MQNISFPFTIEKNDLSLNNDRKNRYWVVGEEIITEGKDVEDDKVEAAICRQLGLPESGQ